MKNTQSKCKRIGIIGAISLCIFCAIGATFANATPAYADTDTKYRESILKKAVMYNVYSCYKTGAIKKKVNNTGGTPGTTKNILNGANKIDKKIPQGFWGTISSTKGKFDCKSIIEKAYAYANDSGNVKPSPVPPDQTKLSEVHDFLTGMGYKGSGDPSNAQKNCVTYNYTTDKADGSAFIQVCAYVNRSTQRFIAKPEFEINIGTDGAFNGRVRGKTISGNKVEIMYYPGAFFAETVTAQWGTDVKWHDFVSSLTGGIKDKISQVKTTTTTRGTIIFKLDPNPVDSPDDGMRKQYKIKNTDDAKKTAGKKAATYLSASEYDMVSRGTAATGLTDQEKFVLLNSYLRNFYQVKFAGCVSTENGKLTGDDKATYDAAKKDGKPYHDKPAFMLYEGELQWCYVKAGANGNVKVNGYNSYGNFDGQSSSQFSFAKVISELKKLKNKVSIEDFPDGEDTFTQNAEGAGSSGEFEEDAAAACFKFSGPLGWIMCPVLKTIGDAAAALYKHTSDDFLQVDASLLAQGDENGAYRGWQRFQAYANIVFAILLIIVIISQLTGFGISNYGIKKALPRLVLGVVLINLSFIICQLAVDLSNILGHELYDFFTETLPGSIAGENQPDGVPIFTSVVGEIVQHLMGTAAIGAGAAGVGYIAVNAIQWDQWMMPLILAIIVCVIAVVFYFVLLAVRKAGIIILVILAPLAIVCYALPNTKKLFDRWYKMFASLLLVYPICGIVMGGSQFMGKLILTTLDEDNASFTMVLSAMLLMVVPFFFIPAILKASFSAMGAIGNRIATFGDRFSRGFARAAKGSELYRNAQREVAKANASYMGKRLDSKYDGDVKNIKSPWARRRYARIAAANEKLLNEDEQAKYARFMKEGDELHQLMGAGIENKRFSEDIKNQESAIELGYDSEISKEQSSDPIAHRQSLDKTLQALQANPDDYRAKVRARSLANRLISFGEPGEDELLQSFYRAEAGGYSDNVGMRNLQSYIMGQHAKTIKDDSKELFSVSNEMQRGKLNGKLIQQTTTGKDGQPIVRYTTLDNASKAVDNMASEKVVGQNESAFRNLSMALKHEAKYDEDPDALAVSDGKVGNIQEQVRQHANSIYGTPQLKSKMKSGGAQELAFQELLIQSMGAKSIANMNGQALQGTANAIKSGKLSKEDVVKVATVANNSMRDQTISHSDSNYNAIRSILSAANDTGFVKFDVPAERKAEREPTGPSDPLDTHNDNSGQSSNQRPPSPDEDNGWDGGF